MQLGGFDRCVDYDGGGGLDQRADRFRRADLPALGRGKVVGADHRRLLPWSTACGAALLCCADAVSRLLARQDLAGTQLPVGVLTALLGGPFFLLMLWERREVTQIEEGEKCRG